MEQACFIDKERERLHELTDKPFSTSEFIQLLILHHQQKMMMKAIKDPDAVPWIYRSLGSNET